MADKQLAIVTGASSGIGAATAKEAAGRGYRLVLAARSKDKLEGLSEELGGRERALPVECDVTEWEDQQSLVGTALEGFGRVDAALANAGIGAKRGFLEESVEHWQAMINTNVLGVALTIRAVLPHFLDRGTGHMLLLGSVAGRRALPGSMYSATKWSVTAMGEALRQEVSDSDIRVTVIEPGMVDTPFFDSRPKEALQDVDIAHAILFAMEQPAHVDVNEILLRPIRQPI